MKPKSTIRGWMASVGLFAMWIATWQAFVATGSHCTGTLMMGGIPPCIGGGIGVLVNGTVKGFVTGTAIVSVIMFVAILLHSVFGQEVR